MKNHTVCVVPGVAHSCSPHRVGFGWVCLGLLGSCLVGLAWLRLGRACLGWIRLSLVGLVWVGLGLVGSGWVSAGLGFVGLGWVWLGRVGLSWVGLDVFLLALQTYSTVHSTSFHHRLLINSLK